MRPADLLRLLVGSGDQIAAPTTSRWWRRWLRSSLLTPTFLGRYRGEGAMVTLTVVGQVRGDVVESADEAERRGFLVEAADDFEPGRVGVGLDERAIAFLARAHAAYRTHMDVEYEPPA